MEPNRNVLVMLSDLIFQVKIADAAKRAGLRAQFVTSPAALYALLAGESISLIIFDLNFSEGAVLETIRDLKAKCETKSIPLLGYISHVQVDLRAAAVEAGCDVVVARSVFVQRLPELLAKAQ